jgi:hypothetical protein
VAEIVHSEYEGMYCGSDYKHRPGKRIIKQKPVREDWARSDLDNKGSILMEFKVQTWWSGIGRRPGVELRGGANQASISS